MVFAISPLRDWFFLIFKPIRNCASLSVNQKIEQEHFCSSNAHFFSHWALSAFICLMLLSSRSFFNVFCHWPKSLLWMVQSLRHFCKPEFCGAQLKTALIYVRHKNHNSQMQHHDHHYLFVIFHRLTWALKVWNVDVAVLYLNCLYISCSHSFSGFWRQIKSK